MDPQLALITAQYIAPFLPVLIAGGTKYVESFMEKAGEGGYEFASNLWARLRGRRQQLDDAAQEVANNKGDEDAVASLRFQLKKLFGEDPELAQEIADMVKDRQNQVTASGERSVAMSGTMKSNTVITGDGNRVEASKDEN